MYSLAYAVSRLFEGGGTGLENDKTWDWVDTVFGTISDILWPVLIVVAAAGMIYAVVLGVNMARADSTEKREEAKKRLFNVFIGLAIIIALILFMQLFINSILPALLPDYVPPTEPTA